MMTQFKPKIFSILKEGYRFTDLRSDLLSGLTVAIVALPLSMAFGIASGASPEQGLITAIIGGFLISLLGGSRVQIGGPTGAFIVVLYSVIAQFGYEGLLVATFLAGVILVIAGYTQLGQLIKFIPQPVITGFTAGIAVLIASTQIRDFLGLSINDVPADFIEKWVVYVFTIDSIKLSSTAIGVMSIGVIFLLRNFAPRLPRYLITLIAASLVVMYLNLDVDTIGSRFPNISPSISVIRPPQISFQTVQDVLPSAFTIAFLAGIEALLSAVIADGMTGFKHRPNQELVAQGIANCSTALFGGIPATGAIARTAINVTAGGRTPFSGIFHSLFLLLFVLFASNSMKFVPMPSLAAILFFVAWDMSEVHRFFRTWSFAGSDRIILLLTFLLTILVDLTVAIAVGVSLASLLFVARMSRSTAIFVSSKGEPEAQRKENYQREELPEGVEAFSITGPLFFGMASDLPDLLKRVGGNPKALIIRMRWVPFMDKSGASALDALVKQCRIKKIEVVFSELQSELEKNLLNFHRKKGWENVKYAVSYEEALSLSLSTQ